MFTEFLDIFEVFAEDCFLLRSFRKFLPSECFTLKPLPSHPQREGTTLGVFVPTWLVLPRCEAKHLGVFDLCHVALLKRGCTNLELAEKGTFPL